MDLQNKKYSILMTTMGLDIGGAETHIVELAKELHKAGHRVIIASNGGVYEKELTDVGIKHYHVPMNRRNLRKMAHSYALLRKIIREEQVDIVHSHARIPGFLVGLLHRKMHFTFVTTAHWVFYTGMGLKYVTNWGQKAIAVSEDIREYLIRNYKMDPRDISVTINGIDTDKFSPDISAANLKRELDIPEGVPVVSYVSRMDEDRAMVGEQLIHIAPKLAEQIPGLRLLIVGGGGVYDALKSQADAVNASLGYPCVIMPGARTDINEVVAAGDVFVGVSRAALEAMAGAKPVILAGNEGYIGLFDGGNFDLARETNFCCRGCALSAEDRLCRDVLQAMALPEAEKKRLGDYGRRVIFAEYSVSRMAKDTLSAYHKAYAQNHERQYYVLMSGYYGFHNAGDDAILLAMHQNIRSMGDDLRITVLSNRPDETRILYDINAVYRFGAVKLLKAIRGCDVLLSGGGSLLQDTTSTRSIMYYLCIILVAKMMGKKVMLYANGIGPVSKARNRHYVKKVVNKADLITLREENSLEELRAIGVTNPNAYVTADPVFTMDGVSKEAAWKRLEEAGIPLDKPIIGVSVRNWKGMEAFADKFAALCDTLVRDYNRTVVFIVMQMPNDVNISRKAQEKMKEKSYILDQNYTPYEIMGIIGCMELVLAMRLHTLIFAARQKVPLMGFIYDPKIAYYLNKLSMPSGGSVDDFSPEAALTGITDMMENRQKYVDILTAAEETLEKAAHENEKRLIELLKGGAGHAGTDDNIGSTL